MPVPEKIRILRMVHWQNVEYILQHGMCSRNHALCDLNYVNIGMRQLIQDRHDYPVPLANKGNLGEYVPFYFAGHSPMLLLIREGNKGVEQRPQQDIVFISCDLNKVFEDNLPYIFTDRNAKIAVANFYTDRASFNLLDWDTILARWWNNDLTDLARQDKKQAEFLIRDHVGVEYINGLIVKTQERKEYFEEMIRNLELGIQVYVDENQQFYY